MHTGLSPPSRSNVASIGGASRVLSATKTPPRRVAADD